MQLPVRMRLAGGLPPEFGTARLPRVHLHVALSEIDRNLLQRCLARKPRAWEDFVDRFMGLVVHVVNHSAQSRSLRLAPEDREDLVAQVFLAVVRDDMAVLRQFRGESSLATYLTVIARRVIVAELLKQKAPSRLAAQPPMHEMAMAGAEVEQLRHYYRNLTATVNGAIQQSEQTRNELTRDINRMVVDLTETRQRLRVRLEQLRQEGDRP